MALKIFTRVEGNITKSTLQLFKQQAAQDSRRLIGAFICIPIATTALTVVTPLLLSLIIQSLITNPQDLIPVYYMIGGIIASAILTILLNDRGYRWLFNHDEYITSKLTNHAVDKLLARSHGFFANNKVGSLTGDLIAFSRSYMTILDATFLQALPIVINFIASLIIIAIIAPPLLLPLGLLTLSIVFMSLQSLNKRAPLRNERKLLNSKLNGTIADIIGNSLLVRVFARSHTELTTVAKNRDMIASIAKQEINVIQREADARYVVLYGFQVATILLCIWLFSHSAITIASLIFTVTYLGRITSSLFNITGFIRQIEQAFLDAAPITKILQEATEVQDEVGATSLHVNKGRIDLNAIQFYYNDKKNAPVFNSLSLHIEAGQRVGLAGHSGGGKTTLTQLLLRFADIQKGNILIDEQDISKVTQKSLYESISYVPQDPFLFHRTLRENIAYGKPDATDKDIMRAAKKANALEFIKELPNGLDTVVGERGVKLSGGQRQRVAIARAILKDAPILILDEATSALDSESERLIQDSLERLMKDRTSIVIAHRLSTIAKLDRIIVLDKGKIIEDGPHAELLKKNGTYAKLWSHQSGGFIKE